MESFLIEVVRYTSGWVIVAVFGLYLAVEVYKKHREGKIIDSAMRLVEGTVKRLLENFHEDITLLTSRFDALVSRIDRMH